MHLLQVHIYAIPLRGVSSACWRAGQIFSWPRNLCWCDRIRLKATSPFDPVRSLIGSSFSGWRRKIDALLITSRYKGSSFDVLHRPRDHSWWRKLLCFFYFAVLQWHTGAPWQLSTALSHLSKTSPSSSVCNGTDATNAVELSWMPPPYWPLLTASPWSLSMLPSRIEFPCSWAPPTKARLWSRQRCELALLTSSGIPRYLRHRKECRFSHCPCSTLWMTTRWSN